MTRREYEEKYRAHRKDLNGVLAYVPHIVKVADGIHIFIDQYRDSEFAYAVNTKINGFPDEASLEKLRKFLDAVKLWMANEREAFPATTEREFLFKANTEN